ncbi:hypothetical protein AB0P00_13600 [Microbacterium sp. NPDC077057]|uniref:hypothetical protein n=1 Tax=Microbacterium sp. NPDC077057 TaxID=3154763 RepID=UPI00343D9D5A
MSEPQDFPDSAAPKADLQGEALMAHLKTKHWFWHWGDESWRDESVPEGMVDPDGFVNFETMEMRSFLEELREDGIELTVDPGSDADQPRFLLGRAAFTEWLIARYLQDAPATLYSQGDLDEYAADKVAAAKADWELEAEDDGYEHSRQLERAEMEAQVPRSGWIYLDQIAEHAGIGADELLRIFGERYSIGLAPGGRRWIAKWFDAFDWLREHYASRWNPESAHAQSSITSWIGEGLSEENAREKVRREFINENAALPISTAVGIHTLGDTNHVHEGYSIIGFDESGEPISSSDEYRWEPNTAKEAEWGFPIRGEGSHY